MTCEIHCIQKHQALTANLWLIEPVLNLDYKATAVLETSSDDNHFGDSHFEDNRSHLSDHMSTILVKDQLFW